MCNNCPSPDPRVPSAMMNQPIIQPRLSRDELRDWIQDACIARARELGLSAQQIADRTKGRVNVLHIQKYLDRRASCGSHKLQHILRALGLTVVASPLETKPHIVQ